MQIALRERNFDTLRNERLVDGAAKLVPDPATIDGTGDPTEEFEVEAGVTE